MGENVCCPQLKVVKCADTKEHKHLYCDPQYAIMHKMIDDDWVKIYCLCEFIKCNYFPRGE